MSSKNTLAAGLFDHALEWYDFILYANFAPIIAALFFPTKNSFTALLLTFAVFATGFLVRPFSALIFGYIGDHFGRRKALIVSIGIMTVSTLLITITPVYAQIGIAAPLLLTALRLLQSAAVSGEFGAATYLIEHAQAHRRGLFGSLVIGIAFFGIFIGALISYGTTSFLSPDALHSWGWRLPFLLGGLLGITGIIIRLRSQESPLFLAEMSGKTQTPLKELFLYHQKPLLIAVLLTSITGVSNYILLAYIVTFLVKFQNFTLQDANLINFISMFVLVILFPIMGSLSDKIGRKPIFKINLISFIVLSLPIFWLLSQKQFIDALIGDILLCIILVPSTAIIPTLIAELFPTQARNSGSVIAYNISLTIFGGTTPLIALELVHRTGSTLAPAGYLIACAILALVSLYFVNESFDKPLQ